MLGILVLAAALQTPGPVPSRDDLLGAWLPARESLFEPWRRHQATKTSGLGFELEDIYGGPARGTGFTYGDAGPPKGWIQYDSDHGIALYRQGCCSWGEVVLVRSATGPPHPVESADLRYVRTRMGIALGARPAEVFAAYGTARLFPSTVDPRYRVAAYWRPMPRERDCRWFTNFVFRGDELVEIESGSAC